MGVAKEGFWGDGNEDRVAVEGTLAALAGRRNASAPTRACVAAEAIPVRKRGNCLILVCIDSLDISKDIIADRSIESLK